MLKMTDESFRNVKGKKGKVLLIVLVVLALAGFAVAVEASGRNVGKRWPLTIRTSDKLEFSGQTFIASGNVEASWRDYRIYADYLEFNRETNDETKRAFIGKGTNEAKQ